MKKLLFVFLTLLLPGIIPLWGQAPAGQDDDALYAQDMIQVGEAFPTVSFGTALDGKDLSVKDFAGQYLVLDFWATWCPDCRKDVPALVEAYKRFASDKVVFVGISWDQDRERLESAWRGLSGKTASAGHRSVTSSPAPKLPRERPSGSDGSLPSMSSVLMAAFCSVPSCWIRS